MTGNELKVLRGQLRVGADEFAQFIGTTSVSLYRWERSGEQQLPLNTAQLGILQQLAVQAEQRGETAGELGRVLMNALIFGGVAWAILKVLEEVFKGRK